MKGCGNECTDIFLKRLAEIGGRFTDMWRESKGASVSVSLSGTCIMDEMAIFSAVTTSNAVSYHLHKRAQCFMCHVLTFY